MLCGSNRLHTGAAGTSEASLLYYALRQALAHTQADGEMSMLGQVMCPVSERERERRTRETRTFYAFRLLSLTFASFAPMSSFSTFFEG